MHHHCTSKLESSENRGSNILIIEDSEFVNDAIKTELDKLGHHCVQAFTLEEALQLMGLMERCDFIILDLHLPDAYGEKLFFTVNAQNDAKIIILTSESDAQIRSSLFKSGALDYILKDENFLQSVLKADETMRNIGKNRGFNILVIDDSMLVRKHVEMVLEVRNYTVLQAQSAKEGLDAIKNEQVDLIILDLELPDMHGTKVLEIIKSDSLSFEIPVLVLSGTNNPELISNVLKGGASDFVQKPFNIEEFVLKVDLWAQLTSKTDQIHYLQQLVKTYKNTIDRSTIMSIANLEGVITHANEKFCEASGYMKEELVGQPHSIIRHPDVSAEVFEKLWQIIQGKKTWSGRLKNQNKNGDTFITDTVITPIIDACGNITEYIATYDIIEVK